MKDNTIVTEVLKKIKHMSQAEDQGFVSFIKRALFYFILFYHSRLHAIAYIG